MQQSDAKPWYQSRTLIGLVVAVVATVLEKAGWLIVSDAEQQQLVDAVVMAAQGGGAGLVAWGRVMAGSQLTFGTGDEPTTRRPPSVLCAPIAVGLAMALAIGLSGCAEYTAAKGAAKEVYQKVRKERDELQVDKFDILRTGLCEADPQTVADMITAGRLDIEAYARICTATYGTIFDKSRAVK